MKRYAVLLLFLSWPLFILEPHVGGATPDGAVSVKGDYEEADILEEGLPIVIEGGKASAESATPDKSGGGNPPQAEGQAGGKVSERKGEEGGNPPLRSAQGQAQAGERQER